MPSPPAMSRKKTPRSKEASAPAASVLPAANGSRPVRPGTACPRSEAPPNGPPQPGRPSLGGRGDFYDVAFKVSRAPTPPPPCKRSKWCLAGGDGGGGGGAVPGQGCRTLGTPDKELAGAAGTVHRGSASSRTHTHTQTHAQL